MNVRQPNHALILGSFCLGFAILLALTNFLTADAIAARALEDRLNSLGQVTTTS